jgi:CBS domain containing-hemolysin-like protein
MVVSAILAIAETGMTRLSPSKARALEAEKVKGAQRLVRLTTHPERWMNSLLFVVLVVQTITATLIGSFSDTYGAWAVALGVFLNVVVGFVIAESIPKTWAVQNPEAAALRTARLVSLIEHFAPLRVLTAVLIKVSNVVLPGKGLREGPWVTQAELLAALNEGVEAGAIDTHEQDLIHSVLELGETIVRECMKPRTDVVSVPSTTTVAAALDVAMAAGYSRLPVTGSDIDDVTGVVLVKDLIRADQADCHDDPVSTLAHEVRFVPETKRVMELIREMQRDKSHLAIVIDEYGGTAGLVTLEDLIEELLGEIVDEFDVEDSPVEVMADGSYRVSGRMGVGEVNDLLGAELPDDDWDTLGGLIVAALGHIPLEGESILVEGFRLTADRVAGRRIHRVRVVALPSVDLVSEAVGADDPDERSG